MNEERKTQLTAKTYLIRDGLQMWLAEKKISKGEEYFRRVSGYYTTYSSLLEGYIREQGTKMGGEDLEEALKKFAGLEKKLREYAKTLGKALDENQQENQQLQQRKP